MTREEYVQKQTALRQRRVELNEAHRAEIDKIEKYHREMLSEEDERYRRAKRAENNHYDTLVATTEVEQMRLKAEWQETHPTCPKDWGDEGETNADRIRRQMGLLE